MKKFKEQNDKKEEDAVEDAKGEDKDLYDADMDDLDSSDLGEDQKLNLKRRNSSVFDPGMQANMASLKKAMYQLTLMVMILFLCSSLFAYLTRRELIFPERSAPKYIFDMI